MMDFLTGPWQFGFMERALVGGILVGTICAVIGTYVVLRGLAFIGDALAHAAFPGVVIAYMLKANIYLGAAIFTVGTALGIAFISRRARTSYDTTIGILFAGAFALGILLMSHDVHAGEHLKDLLVGQILWVSNTQLIATALLTVALLAVWKGLRQRLGNFGFYALFAIAITASVQLVGIYLVFASLIVPALVTYRHTRRRYLFAYVVGIAGYILGLLLSVWLDLPTGAAIVWSMVLCGSVMFFVRK